MKTCNDCGQIQQLEAFPFDRRNTTDGRGGICRTCKSKIQKARAARLAATQGYSPVSTKTCTGECGETKPISDFYKDKATADGHGTLCKACKTKKVYAWRAANKDKYNKSQRDFQRKAYTPEQRYGTEIKRRYGCTLEQYNAMLVAQEGACAICKVLHNPAERKGRLYVDHCHITGAVRALLCKHCNSMLGYAKDDTRVLLEAVAYITGHKKAP